MKNKPIPQLLEQEGSPILLLAYLHREMGHLPRASFTIHGHNPNQLDVSLHRAVADEMPALEAFELWRVALGLGTPTAGGGTNVSWLSVEGHVDDVPVRLSGYGTAVEVEAAAPSAVAA